MSPALEAHLRLLATLPRREHRRPDTEVPYTQPRTPVAPEKIARMFELEKNGVSRSKIAKALRVSPGSVTNHLGKLTVRRYR